MTHLVVVHTTNEKSFFPCDTLDAAVTTIERFRNEENVESCELFELQPISFEFKPYYHVALSAGSSVSAPGAFGAATPAMGTADANSPVLSAVEPSNPFDSVGQLDTTAHVDSAAHIDPLAQSGSDSSSFPSPVAPVAAPTAPSSLDAALADVGVPANPPAPALHEPIPPVPPAPAYVAESVDPMASTAPIVDPYAQSTGPAPTEGLGFELDSAAPSTGFDLAPETPEVAELFGADAELPPPPPPPPLPEVEVESEPKRGLFGR